MNDKYEFIRNNRASYIERDKKKIASLRIKWEIAKKCNDEEELEDLEKKINEALFTYEAHKSLYENMREHTIEDTEERKDIIWNYARKVNETIPDGVPLVFHGNNSIGLVEVIMRSGGLFTPDERGVGYRSLATKIDVGSKKNIQTPLAFAEPGLDNQFLPYGAIFVFMPKEYEEELVLHTGTGTEVPGGVESIDFRKNPERLISIITTNENIERLKKVAMETGIDPDKIVTHQEFLDRCKEKYSGHTR